MEYKEYNANSYNIHTIETKKFKTVRMEIVFSREVDLIDMPKFAFLTEMMSETSQHYKKARDIAIKLEDLYKANFYGTTSKVGNLFTISFIIDFINPKYLNEKKYLEDVIKFPLDIINNPNVNNNIFDEISFNVIKKRLKEEIIRIKESSNLYALSSALKEMDKLSPSSHRVLGTKEDIDKITPKSLYDAYLELFEKFNCDIFLIGDINSKECIKIIENNYENHFIKLFKPNLYVKNKLRKKALIKNKESNFIQSTLVMIYNINNLTKHEKDVNFHVFNYIFGNGGLKSKLYENLRNENSLCYSVRSMYLKYDGLLIVLVSLDPKNVDVAQKLINKSLNEMIKGKFTEDDLNDAIKNLTFALKLNLDSNSSILNNYIFNYFDDLPLLEKRIELIKNVTKEDIMKCANSLTINTIFTLDGGVKNE